MNICITKLLFICPFFILASFLNRDQNQRKKEMQSTQFSSSRPRSSNCEFQFLTSQPYHDISYTHEYFSLNRVIGCVCVYFWCLHSRLRRLSSMHTSARACKPLASSENINRNQLRALDSFNRSSIFGAYWHHSIDASMYGIGAHASARQLFRILHLSFLHTHYTCNLTNEAYYDSIKAKIVANKTEPFSL